MEKQKPAALKRRKPVILERIKPAALKRQTPASPAGGEQAAPAAPKVASVDARELQEIALMIKYIYAKTGFGEVRLVIENHCITGYETEVKKPHAPRTYRVKIVNGKIAPSPLQN